MTKNSFQDNIRHLAYDQTVGKGPGVVFLAGFASNKSGNKALFLEDWAKSTGRAFLRFDYSGHGESTGRIADLGISDWADDAEAIIRSLTQGKQILVGSSMGGWVGLLLAKRIPERIAGLVTIAAAPDFTEDRIWAELTEDERAALTRDGRILLTSEYLEEPYVLPLKRIEDGRKNLVMRDPMTLPFPTRILHGTKDTTIPVETAHRMFNHFGGDDVQLNIMAGADHRFSTPDCLALIRETIEEVCERVGR